jgi:hypothetical protein
VATPQGQGPAYAGSGGGSAGPAAGAAAGAGIVGLLGVAALIAIAIALFLLQSSVSEQSCIRKAEAQFPTVPVSAFVTGSGKATGPLKVSNGAQRSAAVKAC